jgi:hypothetical protein
MLTFLALATLQNSDFDTGASLAKRRQAFVRTYGQDRKTLGTWWSGHRRESTEWVLRLSPAFTARWLGYWEWIEMWPQGEGQRRWEGFQKETAGGTHFFVLLSAFPKASTLEITDPAPADTRFMEDVRFSLTAGGKRISLRSRVLDRRQVRDRDEIQEYRWWRRVPGAAWLSPDTLSEPNDPRFGMGDYYGVYYHVWIDEPVAAPYQFEVGVRRKVRSAEFRS